MWFIYNTGEKVAKGMKIVLQERGLWRDKLRKKCKKEHSADKNCCALRILETQPDFANQKGLLEEIVVGAGHFIVFYPKFHCELNYIEQFWGSNKDIYSK